MKRHRFTFCRTAVLIFTAIIILSADYSGLYAADTGNYASRINRVEFDGGYFMNRREEFRDIYGEGAAFSLSFERYWREKLSYRITAGYLKLQDMDYSPEYRDLTIAGTMNYTLAQMGVTRMFAGGGFGLSARTINITVTRYIPEESVSEYDQTEYSPFALILVGGDIGITGPLYFGVRGMFNYHFGGDASVGEFGDSGGYTFSGGIGLAF